MKMCRKHRRIRTPLLILSLVLAVHLPIWADVPAGHAAEEQSFGIRNPITGSDGVTIWDCVYFGNYWQNDTNGDGKADRDDAKEPIRWRVLSVKGNDAFLLADKNLDMKQYNDMYKAVTWKTCSLRTWLNKDFLNDAFTAVEKSAIQQTAVVNENNASYGTDGGNDTKDSVYLLSLTEAQNADYGFNSSVSSSDSRKALNTAYATAQGAYESSSGNGYWRLRSPGDNNSRASYVSYDGSVSQNGNNVNDSTRAVRPVLHLDLSIASGWSYIGTVNSKNLYQEAPAHTAPSPSPAPVPEQPGASTIQPSVPSSPVSPGQPGASTVQPSAPSSPVSSKQPGGNAVQPSSPSSSASPEQPGSSTVSVLPDDDPDTPPGSGQGNEQVSMPKAGSIVTVSGFQYKIQKSSEKERTVAVIKAGNKKIKKAAIPNSVKIQSFTFKVVEISKNAFKGCTQLQTATIGKEVRIIGSGAFSGCKKIKKVTIRSKVLQKIGKGAFAGVSRKAKIQVPKSKVAQYRKLMKKG